MSSQISKKRKFVAEGLFFAELNAILSNELAEEGFSGVEVRVTPNKTEIIIRATRTSNVLGEGGRRIRELTSVIEKRFKFDRNTVELFAERVNDRALCAVAQSESLRYRLIKGIAVRRACYGVLRYIMMNRAKGCEIVVSGKLRAQRAKSMKFRDGYMIKSGHSVNEYVDKATRHIKMRLGVLGIKVAIMLPQDPTGELSHLPHNPLADVVTILDKDEKAPSRAKSYKKPQQEEPQQEEPQNPEMYK